MSALGSALVVACLALAATACWAQAELDPLSPLAVAIEDVSAGEGRGITAAQSDVLGTHTQQPGTGTKDRSKQELESINAPPVLMRWVASLLSRQGQARALGAISDTFGQAHGKANRATGSALKHCTLQPNKALFEPLVLAGHRCYTCRRSLRQLLSALLEQSSAVWTERQPEQALHVSALRRQPLLRRWLREALAH